MKTIHVDKVDIEKGVYFKWDSGPIHWVVKELNSDKVSTVPLATGIKGSSWYPDLRTLVSTAASNSGYYTLEGERIVLEEEHFQLDETKPEETWKPINGELIEAIDDEATDIWDRVLYVGSNPDKDKEEYPHIVVKVETGKLNGYQKIRQIQYNFSLQEAVEIIAKHNNLDVTKVSISV